MTRMVENGDGDGREEIWMEERGNVDGGRRR